MTIETHTLFPSKGPACKFTLGTAVDDITKIRGRKAEGVPRECTSMGVTRTSASAVAFERKHDGASRRKYDIYYAVVTDLPLPGFSRRLSPVAAD